MLLYVLYACVHLDAGKHASQADYARCVEAQAYFHLAECEEELARAAGLRQHGKHPQSWLECQETKAD
ncbi:MAG: hypothetical protein KGJ72_07570, partial [Gammaproteobacteria bacterium]|nr:hypothetical protein [Gammaproteobacteria bacterium]